MRDLSSTFVNHARSARLRAVVAFESAPSGRKFCRSLTHIADNLLTHLLNAAQSRADDPGIAVVATGGYGRRELAPFSDLDITFIAPSGYETESEQIVRDLFRLVVDSFSALDWPVGYAFRLPSDCPALDSKTRTGLIDARLVGGSSETLSHFNDEFARSFPVADFLIEKLEERTEMRSKWHDTPRVVEFNLRDGAGGLRDAQTLRWLAYAMKRPLGGAPRDAEEALLLYRNALHIATQRKQDVLARTRLGDVARIVGREPEEIVSAVIRSGERIDGAWSRGIEIARQSSFSLASGVSATRGEGRIEEDAPLTEAVIGVCRAVRLGLRIKPATGIGDEGNLARTVGWITRGASEIRALDRSGLLARLIPELSLCMDLPSQDSVHRYSVGEHTLQVIESLDRLRSVRELASAWSDVPNRRPLILAALLHDVGKSDKSASHSQTGARMAREVCERLGVADDELDSTSWLVLHHLELARIARTHDLSDPSTYVDLVRTCDRADRLAMLYLLTLADTDSVAPGVLTPHLESSLKELYERTRSILGGEPIPDDPAVFRSEAERKLRSGGRPDVEQLLREMPTHYLLATPTEMFPLHSEYVRRASDGETLVVFQHDQNAHTTEITICTRDLPEPGLLSRIFGVIYALDISVHDARAASTATALPIALDTITVSYQGNPLPTGLCRALTSELQNRLGSAEAIVDFLRAHGKEPDRRQTMLTYTFHEGTPGVLEFQTPPGRGMPYRVAKLLAEFGWNVYVARMGVYADRAVARFYVGRPSGKPLSSSEVDRKLASAD